MTMTLALGPAHNESGWIIDWEEITHDSFI